MAFVSPAAPDRTTTARTVRAGAGDVHSEPASHAMALATSEILFRPGDAKAHFYRVESGVVCVYQSPWQGNRATVEFCFPGDLVGLGFLERHTSTARAAVETVVTCLPLDAMNDLVALDPIAGARLSTAVDREFESLRRAHLDAPKAPIGRVAALLVSLSRTNVQEGRDPATITDSLKCGVIADYLSMSVDQLAGVLVDLERQGMIERSPAGNLRLTDLDGLDRLADGVDDDDDDDLFAEITEDALTESLLRAPPAFLRRDTATR